MATPPTHSRGPDVAAYLAERVSWPIPMDWPVNKHYWRDVGQDDVSARIIWRCLKRGVKTLLREPSQDGPCQYKAGKG